MRHACLGKGKHCYGSSGRYRFLLFCSTVGAFVSCMMTRLSTTASGRLVAYLACSCCTLASIRSNCCAKQPSPFPKFMAERHSCAEGTSRAHIPPLLVFSPLPGGPRGSRGARVWPGYGDPSQSQRAGHQRGRRASSQRHEQLSDTVADATIAQLIWSVLHHQDNPARRLQLAAFAA